MYKHSENVMYHPLPSAVAGLVEPSRFIAEGVVSSFAGVYRFAARTVNSLKRRFTLAHASDELSRLDDAVLKDIGLERSDINAFVYSLVENQDDNMHQFSQRRTAGF
jgi:uncharacterized protein YjiS (DUF1127 family)